MVHLNFFYCSVAVVAGVIVLDASSCPRTSKVEHSGKSKFEVHPRTKSCKLRSMFASFVHILQLKRQARNFLMILESSKSQFLKQLHDLGRKIEMTSEV